MRKNWIFLSKEGRSCQIQNLSLLICSSWTIFWSLFGPYFTALWPLKVVGKSAEFCSKMLHAGRLMAPAGPAGSGRLPPSNCPPVASCWPCRAAPAELAVTHPSSNCLSLHRHRHLTLQLTFQSFATDQEAHLYVLWMHWPCFEKWSTQKKKLCHTSCLLLLIWTILVHTSCQYFGKLCEYSLWGRCLSTPNLIIALLAYPAHHMMLFQSQTRQLLGKKFCWNVGPGNYPKLWSCR